MRSRTGTVLDVAITKAKAAGYVAVMVQTLWSVLCGESDGRCWCT